jgi:hypothetical protein
LAAVVVVVGGVGGELSELCQLGAHPRTSPRTCNEVNVYVIPFPVVRTEECFYMAPRALDGVGMSASTPINEANTVIDGAVR